MIPFRTKAVTKVLVEAEDAPLRLVDLGGDDEWLHGQKRKRHTFGKVVMVGKGEKRRLELHDKWPKLIIRRQRCHLPETVFHKVPPPVDVTAKLPTASVSCASQFRGTSIRRIQGACSNDSQQARFAAL